MDTKPGFSWDNGKPPPENWVLILSKLDDLFDCNAQVADDFMYQEEATEIWGVHWWGNFWGVGNPIDPLDFNIYFYADDGTGTAPTGAGMEHPETTALATYFISDVLGVNDSGQRFYSVDLPTPFTALPGEKYWLVVQAVFEDIPKWGRVTNEGTIYLAPSVYGCPLLGDPFWTNLGYGDMAWYLTGRDTTPPEITDVTLTTSEPLDTQPGFGWENFTCTVTDGGILDVVQLNLTVTAIYPWCRGYPTTEDTYYFYFPMSNIHGTDVYYYNTTFSGAGDYTYHIWANDTSGNQNSTLPEPFFLPLNADVDMGGMVHFMDLIAVSLMYNDLGPDGWVRADVDNNGIVHFMDLIAISLHYNEEW